jgi:hypothetical protein
MAFGLSLPGVLGAVRSPALALACSGHCRSGPAICTSGAEQVASAAEQESAGAGEAQSAVQQQVKALDQGQTAARALAALAAWRFFMRRPSSPRNSDIAPNAPALPAAIISRRSNVLLALGARSWHDSKRGESSRRTPQAFTKGQPPLSSGRNASSGLIVETSLK